MSGSNLSDASSVPVATLPPDASATAAPGPASARGGRHAGWKLLFLLVVCVSPVVASYFTYYVVRPEGRRNFGELVEPLRPMPELATATLDGHGGSLQALRGQWLLVSAAPGACDAACQNHLYLQRQMRESLGKDKDRLDWVWLVTDTGSPPAEIQPGLRQATVLRVDAEALSRWLEPAPGHGITEHLYVVDPMGNWMMRFPAAMDTAAAAKAKKDLERLMRASASWDTAGRMEKK
ncbi:hypothetical protein [Simplicispira lacusdiani]|uniref:hypothetical protein n=1 Tax=Simplicispira lacusdiani TaxID=2213010 RepID=UPI000E718FE7|nr:hypothetical protein [Simplicispira lacusdiani]